MLSMLNMGTGAMVAIAVVVVLALVGIWVFTTYNSLVKLRNNVEEGFSTMDVYMKKRYDLIPNLVEVVKGYAKHEKETLTEVVNLRNSCISADGINDKIKAEEKLASSLKTVFALAENYPDLKANANYIDLQQKLADIESEISQARKYYNSVVKMLNTKIEMFPSNFIAKKFKFEKAELFEITDAVERENVKVKF